MSPFASGMNNASNDLLMGDDGVPLLGPWWWPSGLPGREILGSIPAFIIFFCLLNKADLLAVAVV